MENEQEKQTERLLKLGSFVEDRDLAVYEELIDINDTIDEIESAIEDFPFDEIKLSKGEKGDKGDQGEKGEKGDKGDQGIAGKDGRDGRDGRDGLDGEDGEVPGRTLIEDPDAVEAVNVCFEPHEFALSTNAMVFSAVPVLYLST
jgi:hypothetical protein